MDYKESYDLISKYINEIECNEKYKVNGRLELCKDIFKKLMSDLGFTYKNMMVFGNGTSHHICEKDLPYGTLIAQISKGVVCIKNHVQYNKFDVSREGTRCCYGIWEKE